MARKKIVDTTATESPTHRETVPEAIEVEDPFVFFKDETQDCLIAVRRMEPTVEQGQVIAGHLPSLTLSPSEAQNLVGELINRPGYGGGLYAIQHQRRKVNGGYEFASSFRLRVAGRCRAMDLFQKPNNPPPPPASAQFAGSPGSNYPQPPAWYYQAPPQQQIGAGPSMAELPRLLEALSGIVRQQVPAVPPQMDMVQMIQALQRTVQPEDELSKFAKFAAMIDKLRGNKEDAPAGASVDWGSAITAFREILRPTPAQPPQPAPQPVVGPPGWNWTGSGWAKAPTPAAPPRVSAPPGWQWNGSAWSQVVPMTPDSDVVPMTSDSDVTPMTLDDEDEEDDGSDEGATEEPPLSADELGLVVATEFKRMPPGEQAKMLALARGMLAQE